MDFSLVENLQNLGDLCEDPTFVGDMNPRLQYIEQPNEHIFSAAARWTRHFEDKREYFNHYYPTRRIEKVEWFEEFWRGKSIGNLITHYFTSITYLKEVCRELYPSNATASESFLDNCALAHFVEFREGESWAPPFLFDYLKDWYHAFDDISRDACGYLLCFGMILNLLQIGFKFKHVRYIIVLF